MNPDLARKAGLIESGVDEEGETVYLGTFEQWERYKKLEQILEDNNQED